MCSTSTSNQRTDMPSPGLPDEATSSLPVASSMTTETSSPVRLLSGTAISPLARSEGAEIGSGGGDVGATTGDGFGVETDGVAGAGRWPYAASAANTTTRERAMPPTKAASVRNGERDIDGSSTDLKRPGLGSGPVSMEPVSPACHDRRPWSPDRDIRRCRYRRM